MQKAKYKHNKKRNVGFLYAILIQELTKTILNKDKNQEKIIKKIICESFNKDSELKKELDIFKQFKDVEKLENKILERLLDYAKAERKSINENKLQREKTEIIHRINRSISQEIYNNFVPNYKFLASLDQILSNKLSLKDKVIIEHRFLEDIELNKEKFYTLPSIDNLTFKTFVEKFNDKYSSLLKEQKELLFNYVLSLEQNNLNFKFYINEEIHRMKKIINETKETDRNKEIMENKDKLIEKLDEFKAVEISQEMLTNILKIQDLVNTLCRSN